MSEVNLVPQVVNRPGIASGAMGRLAEAMYLIELRRRNRKFDKGERVVRLDRPVISIGNLSVGGTGKTPMVERVCRELLGQSHKPCIAMRGYKSKGPNGSDEAASYGRTLPEVPVVAQADRLTGLFTLFASEIGAGVDCVVLDDGFQHRRIARDLDVVLVDASRSPFTDRCLPAGWLREPPTSLARADAVVLTHAELAQEGDIARLCAEIERAHGKAPIAVTEHAWASLDVLENGMERTEPVDWLWHRGAIGACAIGHPEGFLRSLRGATGGRLMGELVLRDHDVFNPTTVEKLIQMARGARTGCIVVTDKDWSKLRSVPTNVWPCPVVRPRLELVFRDGLDAFGAAILAAAGRSEPQG